MWKIMWHESGLVSVMKKPFPHKMDGNVLQHGTTEKQAL